MSGVLLFHPSRCAIASGHKVKPSMIPANQPLRYHNHMRRIEVCGNTAHRSTRSNVCPLTLPPPRDERTLRLKPSRFALRSSAASLFNGSDAFGSRKRNCLLLVTCATNLAKPLSQILRTCRPTTTAFKFSTGFQSSRNMFRHTLPSRSMFGW
jgi:hypothetical protein